MSLPPLIEQFRPSRFWRCLPAGMRRRWWLFRPLDLIARHFPIFRKRSGVLIIRMDGIGDMVLFRASLDAYAEALGVEKGDLIVLGCESWGSLGPEVFKGYRLIVIDEHSFARRPFYRFRISLEVRALAPKMVVLDSYFRRAMMADSLAWVAGAPKTVVSLPYVNEPTRAEFTYYLSQANEIIDTGPYPTHEVTRHFTFLSQVAGREITPLPPEISWRDRPAPMPEGSPYVVLNPGSNEHGRRWPLASYVATGRRLIEHGFRVAVIGIDEEWTDEPGFRDFAAHDQVIDLIGQTSLDQVLDLMKQAALVISNDSGPAHLSIALGVPTVVIVGGGHFGSFFPYPDGVAPKTARFVYQEMECYHCFWRCHKRDTKFEVFACIEAVGQDQVWSAIDALMDLPVKETAK
ncbi:MAG: glycosyltransferase family 9 protein [Magnetovibrionaceae bacterium]